VYACLRGSSRDGVTTFRGACFRSSQDKSKKKREDIMKTRLSHIPFAVVAVAAITFSLAVRSQAQTYNILYSFAGTSDGKDGADSLIFDSAGNLYGTTSDGGSACTISCGTVFELSPNGTGGWTEQVIYAFTGGAAGFQPEGSLVMDAAGNLYGTTDSGGTCCGTIYKLTHNSDGSWTHSVLYTFVGGSDGGNPIAGLALDSAGNLYGTTQYGGGGGCGIPGCGTIFELSPTSTGSWSETLLHIFHGPDGQLPQANLILDAAGNLYGTALEGGKVYTACSSGCGLVFKLTPSSSGKWTEKIIHYFDGTHGNGPFGGLTFDSAGNLYGTTGYGGILRDCGGNGCGVVFELSLNSSGVWQQTRLYNFHDTDGAQPFAGVVVDGSGNVFGTTSLGGDLSCIKSGCGVAYELTPSSTHWTQTVLHVFGSGSDGFFPDGGLILDSAGNVYGMTLLGGTDDQGELYEITP
jgi:hypothetical protein